MNTEELREMAEQWPNDALEYSKQIIALCDTLSIVETERDTYKQLAMDERAALMKASMRLTEAQKVAAFFASVIKSGEGWSDTCQEMLNSI
jgi:hypothetical protein